MDADTSFLLYIFSESENYSDLSTKEVIIY